MALRELRPTEAVEVLTRECGDDAVLREEVESLLAYATAPGPAGVAEPQGPGRRVGKFLLRRVIASGGMGTVYEALEEYPRRVVALKVMRAGIASPQALRRFEHEAQVLARLRHPGIAHIYEAGVHEEEGAAVPYFAMELVPDGLPITAHAEQRGLSTRDRLELFARVCDAVHHGHQRGIIHRDLKPSNILVDPAGQPKVIDFGVARSTDSDLAVTTLQTDAGQIIGTLRYMSPEQCAADPHDLDIRSDVYALGVVLYELLTGRPPYDLSRAPLHEAARLIREQPPARPSTIVRALRGDLETIALKALEKDRRRRYGSAAALAEDARRYLRSEPIMARPQSMAYQVRMFARRNRAVFNGAIALLIVLLLGAGTSTWGFVGQRAQRLSAEQRGRELEQIAEFQAHLLSGIDAELMGARLREDLLSEARAVRERAGLEPARIDAVAAELERLLAGVNFTNVGVKSLDRNVLQRALRAIDEQFAGQPAVQARLLHTAAQTFEELGLYDEALPPQRRALQIRRQVLGDDDPATIESISNVGVVLHMQGLHEDAEPYYREALERRRRALGDDDPRTLSSTSLMGAFLYAQGRLAEADLVWRDTLDRQRRVLGDDHPDTLSSITNMGIVLLAQSDPEAAEPYVREALDKSRRILGDDHPETLAAINNVAGLLWKEGRHADAEPYAREALERSRRVLGDDHPYTLQRIHNLGKVLQDQGKLADSEPILQEALDTSRRVLGDDHPVTLGSMHSFGMLRRAQGRLSDAEPYLRKAMEGSRRAFPEDHPERLTRTSTLAGLLRQLGRPDEAEPLYREAAAGFEHAEGKDHWHTGNIRRGLGVTLAGLGRFAEAEIELLEAERVLASAEGAPPDRHKECLAALAALYESWNGAEPGRGLDVKAAEWRARLDQAAAAPGPAPPP